MVIPAVVALFIAGALVSRDSDSAGIFWGGIVIAILAARPSVTIRPEGLTVSNVFPHRYGWDEITEVGMEYRSYYPILTLHLKDGGRKRVWAVAVGNGGFGSGWTAQTASRIRVRWEEETGTPPARPMFF